MIYKKTKSIIVLALACAGTCLLTAQDPASALPTDAGVYMKNGSATVWTEVEPEVVNWKSGGVAKSAFSYGMVKGDVNGHLKGETSQFKMSFPNQLLVVATDGVSITEYQLLRMRQHSNNREFRAATGGVFHQSGGSDRDVVEFEHKKIASRTYLVTISTSTKDGEYGLMPPGAVGSKSSSSIGKMYSFHIANQ
jgi:hypothetical protein